jgi:hypothetical protein
MSRGKLTWYQLRFPRDLEVDAVIAALASLSGVPHTTRLVFDLVASREGPTHRLGVTTAHAQLVTGGVLAAIPSLRIDRTASPDESLGRRSRWQLAPRSGVLRSDNLVGISGALLASLVPLGEKEHVLLRWSARPGLRPRLEDTPELRRTGRMHAQRQKLVLPGLLAHGELTVHASSPRRARQLFHRIGAALRSLSTPYGRLIPDQVWWARIAYLVGARGHYLSVAELAAVIGWPIGTPDVPGLELGAARRVPPTRAVPSQGRRLGTSDFPQLSRPIALSMPASTRGLHVLGPTGTGKTSLLKHLISQDLKAGRGLAVVETNGDLITDLLDLVPPERERDVVLIDPTDRSYAVGFNPFAESSDAALVADQLGELFQRLWKEYWGPRTSQLAHMGLLTLARRPGSTLLDLPRLYLDPTFRAGVVGGLDDPVGLGPDWQWFAALGEREQATVIAPLLNKVRQFTARPAMRPIIGQAVPALPLKQLMAKDKILLVNLPKGLIGVETATLLGCMVLTALWQAFAARAAIAAPDRRPFAVYVDEVQDFAHAPIPWSEMFSQGRKYALALTVAHQNLDQLPRELREAILANARSRVVFTPGASDARVLARDFEPSLTAADLLALDAFHAAATLALDSGGAAPPVTLRTDAPLRPLGSQSRVRTFSRRQYARSIAAVEGTLRAQVVGDASPVGRRPRRPA